VKRKQPILPVPVQSDTIVPAAIIEEARRAIEADRVKKPPTCVICGGEATPNATEALCWVCRRLKLSAWRDSDSQISAQE
jgi:hypothetical protein